MCPLITKNDLEYWGFEKLLLESCCTLKYFSEIDQCAKEMEDEKMADEKIKERRAAEDRSGKIQKYLWNLVENPETSKPAQVCSSSKYLKCSSSKFCAHIFFENSKTVDEFLERIL